MLRPDYTYCFVAKTYCEKSFFMKIFTLEA